jgi:hypothetical membrane protein
VDVRDRRWVALRWLSLCGIAAPLLDAAVNAFVAKQQPGYSFVKQYASDLAAPGRHDSEVLCLLWASFPLLFGPFAGAVYVGLRGHRFGRIPSLLLGLFALFIGLCGIFRYHPSGSEHLEASLPHVIVSSLASLVLFPAPLFLWLATRDDARWQTFRRFSLLVQVGGVGAAFLLLLAFLELMPWGGFAERTYWGVYYVWFVGLGLKLRRLGREASSV